VSIRQRLYPEPAKEEILHCHSKDARYVYNIALEQRNLWRRERTQKITYVTQAQELALARKAFSWLGEGSSVVQQAALRDLAEPLGTGGQIHNISLALPGVKLV